MRKSPLTRADSEDSILLDQAIEMLSELRSHVDNSK